MGYFFYTVIGAWNALSGSLVETGTIVTFKRHSDKYMNVHGMERYGSYTARKDQFNLKDQTSHLYKQIPFVIH